MLKSALQKCCIRPGTLLQVVLAHKGYNETMSNSQNGWPVLTKAPSYAPGYITGRILAEVAPLFDYLAARFTKEVEPIDKGSSWGWANRPIRGGTTTSNHASGTAVDFNAPRHPLGRAGTFTAGQVRAIHGILADLGGVIRWGGDYSGRKDEMHFEINATGAKCRAVMAQLAVKAEAPKQNAGGQLQLGDTGAQVKNLQVGLERVFPAYSRAPRVLGVTGGKNIPLSTDGVFGQITRAWLEEFQQRAGLPVSGTVDSATSRALASFGIKL